MSSAGIQKLFCGIYSTFKCSFDEFVGEKVFSPSYSSAILAPPPSRVLLKPFKAYFPIVAKLAYLNFINLFWIILFAFLLYLGFSLQSLKTYIKVLIILLYQSYKARTNFNNICLQLDSSKKNPVDNVCLRSSNTEPDKENMYYCKVSEKLTTLGLMKAGFFFPCEIKEMKCSRQIYCGICVTKTGELEQWAGRVFLEIISALE